MRPIHRRRLLGAALAAAAALLLAAGPASAAEVVDQKLEVATTTAGIGGLALGQQFTAGLSGPLTKIDVNLWCSFGGQSGTLSLYAGAWSWWNTVGVGPPLPAPIATRPINLGINNCFSSPGIASNWRTFSFFFPPPVTAGQTYTFRLEIFGDPQINALYGSGYGPGDSFTGFGGDLLFRTYVFTTNAPPSFGAVGPFAVDEGGTASLTATATDPEGGAPTYDWDLDDNGTFETPGQSVSFSAAALDGPASATVRVRATDPGGLTASATTTVSVANVAPTATLDAPASVDEGSAFAIELDGATDAAAADVLSFAFDCGDGAGYGPASSTPSTSCATSDDDSRSIRAKVTDDDGGSTEYTSTVAVANVAPTATFTAPAAVDVFDSFALALTAVTDPGADTHEFRFDCGDGSGYGVWGTSGTASCATSAVGTRTVRGEVRDEDGGSTEYTASVDVVDDTAPTGTCEPGTNPSGKNKPNANAGFRLVTGADNVAVASIVIADTGSAFESGPVPSGSTVKLTQDPDGPAQDVRPGPGVILAQITTIGDPVVRITDSSGNVTEVSCGNLPPG